MRTSRVYPFIAAIVFAGCAHVPTGPNVTALPGRGKSFDEFQYDDAVCRDWASDRTGISANRAANDSTLAGAGVGTLLGAATGAAIGAASGNPATGAAVGAGAGLLGGTAVGAANGEEARYTVQHRYDAAYVQCMYARGNKVPVARGSMPREYSSAPPPPPREYSSAPPPPPREYSSAPPPPRRRPPPPSGRPPGPPPDAYDDDAY